MMPAMPPNGVPIYDHAATFPEIHGWRAAARAGDLAALEQVFRTLPDEDARAFAFRVFADVDGTEDGLARAAATPGARVFTRLLYGARLLEVGWAIRTGARAREVSREQFAGFHDHLRRAEQILIDVTAHEPDNSAAWLYRLMTARGLELGKSEARRRYQRNAANYPHHSACQSQLLQQLCPKWSGSWEDAFGFARERASAAPEGSTSPVLVAEAYAERWMDDKEWRPALKLRQAQEELIDAAHRSVLSPHYRPNYSWVYAHSTFAMVFSIGDNPAAAAPHFRALGDRCSRFPWAYLAEPEAKFLSYRAAAFRAAGGLAQ
jgi:hypothetical protein